MSYPKRPRTFWPALLEQAAALVDSRGGVTLRGLHYLLVSSENEYRNNSSDYHALSAKTAEGRREGWFPALTDRTRSIYSRGGFDSVADALGEAAADYRRDYREGQSTDVWIVVEKATLMGMAEDWADPYGVPFVALGGYGSQTIMDDISRMAGGGAVALYVGDFDPSGIDIERDFQDKTYGAWSDVVRIAVTSEQVAEYDLPPAPGKWGDSRAGGFMAVHGELVQVEVEAFDVLHPTVFSDLVTDAIEEHTDMAKSKTACNTS
jgi:hypothetical protein